MRYWGEGSVISEEVIWREAGEGGGYATHIPTIISSSDWAQAWSLRMCSAVAWEAALILWRATFWKRRTMGMLPGGQWM